MGRRKMTNTGRERQAEAGRRNLEEWHARAEADTLAQVEKFRADLFAELGTSPSVTRRALAETLVANYHAILQVAKEMRKSRLRNRLRVADRVSWLTGNLARLLKTLDLDRKPRPRFLGDTDSSKVEQTSEIHRSKYAIPAPKLAEMPRSEEKS